MNKSHMADLGQLGSVSTMIRNSRCTYSPNDFGTVRMFSSNRQTSFSSPYFAITLAHSSKVYLNSTE